MEEKIPYWKSNRFLGAFILKDGEQGCVVCTDETIRLSLDRPPPPLRDQPPPPKVIQPIEKKKDKDESRFLLNIVAGVEKVAQAKRRFDTWLDTPIPPKETEKVEVSGSIKPSERIPAFDIQQIPGVIRSLGMPKAAKIFDKWFAGELNYAPDDDAAQKEINQAGVPFPVSMYDRTSISLEWVLQFSRARKAFELLQTHDWLTRPIAMQSLKNILSKYSDRGEIRSETECGGDILKIHTRFQFQLNRVEGTLAQKVDQFLLREVAHRGVPDELTMILGSFNFYAAISRAIFGQDRGGNYGLVTHIYIYTLKMDLLLQMEKVSLPSILGTGTKTALQYLS
ncbi:hypothetical protein GN316_10275 [Xylophilus sp. Kf1]|nr:hypothetical protein [Xylophilus sp. Kf1]